MGPALLTWDLELGLVLDYKFVDSQLAKKNNGNYFTENVIKEKLCKNT